MGTGSTFWFEVPLPLVNDNDYLNKRSVNSSLEKQKLQEQRELFKGKRILVAEDNQVNQLVIRGILKRVGVDPVIVNNGEEVIEEFTQQGNYDLVLMDCYMPKVNGFQATEALRRFESEKGLQLTPIVALTARADLENKKDCSDAGMQGHVSKPIDGSKLFDEITQYLI